MEAEELVAAAEGMEVDDLADLVGDLPETVTRQLLRSMDQQDRERLRTVLAFEENSAGGLMNTDTVSVRADVTLEVVLRYLRMRGELPEKTDTLFIVDRNDRYLGTVQPDHAPADGRSGSDGRRESWTARRQRHRARVAEH